MYEIPPILQGEPEDQLRQLRDYLARMARDLDRNIEKSVDSATEQLPARFSALVKQNAVEEKRQSNELRSLIVKTADTINHTIELITQELHEGYLALSDFGTYQEQINTTIETTARGIVESYDFQASIDALDGRVGSVETIQGEIRRGLITDPMTGETAMGIAISEKLDFTGTEVTENNLTYYELSPGQTLGLYTATGWQFWLNGSKRGWFDSRDDMLHVANLAVENSLYLGEGWLLTVVNGFGIRHIGGT